MSTTYKRNHYAVTVYPKGLGGEIRPSNPEAHLLRGGFLCALRTQLTAANALGALQLWANEYTHGDEKETITALIRSALAAYGFAGMDAAGFLIPISPTFKPWREIGTTDNRDTLVSEELPHDTEERAN